MNLNVILEFESWLWFQILTEILEFEFQCIDLDLQAFSNYCLFRFAGTLPKLPGNNFGGISWNCLNFKSTASHKCASKKFPGTLLNCLQKIPGTLLKLPPKLSWHFAKSATKNYVGALPNASSKTLLAVLKTARNNFSRPHLIWHFLFCL
jgi:hypothetical protein